MDTKLAQFSCRPRANSTFGHWPRRQLRSRLSKLARRLCGCSGSRRCRVRTCRLSSFVSMGRTSRRTSPAGVPGDACSHCILCLAGSQDLLGAPPPRRMQPVAIEIGSVSPTRRQCSPPLDRQLRSCATAGSSAPRVMQAAATAATDVISFSSPEEIHVSTHVARVWPRAHRLSPCSCSCSVPETPARTPISIARNLASTAP